MPSRLRQAAAALTQRVHFHRSRLFLSLGHYRLAKPWVEKAIGPGSDQVTPAHAMALNGAAILACMTGDYDRAERFADECRRLVRTRGYAFMEISGLLNQAGRSSGQMGLPRCGGEASERPRPWRRRPATPKRASGRRTCSETSAGATATPGGLWNTTACPRHRRQAPAGGVRAGAGPDGGRDGPGDPGARRGSAGLTRRDRSRQSPLGPQEFAGSLAVLSGLALRACGARARSCSLPWAKPCG